MSPILYSLTHGHHEASITLPTLRPGMVVAMFMDDGPSGICGQSMSITCPHQAIHIFKDEDQFRDWHEAHGPRRGLNGKWAYAVVGSHGTGNMSIVLHAKGAE